MKFIKYADDCSGTEQLFDGMTHGVIHDYPVIMDNSITQ